MAEIVRKRNLANSERRKRGEYKLSITSNIKFSSKEERRILAYLKEKYPGDEWTSGGTLKIDESLISRDMYSQKLKICFEYDGVWHFKDIYGQLDKKKHKDHLLNKWCEFNNWKIIRISETWWHENEKDLSLIDNLIVSSGLIVFKGNEYNA
jgi:hypothetical protein